MSELDLTEQVGNAITSLNCYERSAQVDIELARKNVIATKEAHKAAKAYLTVIEEIREKDIEAIRARRRHIAQLLQSPLVGQEAVLEDLFRRPFNPDRAPLALHESVQRTGATTTTTTHPITPNELSPTQNRTLASTAVANFQGLEVAKARYKRDPGYLIACPVIIPADADGTWIELRCGLCNTNCDRAHNSLLKGAGGLQVHVRRLHERSIDIATVIREGTFRKLSQSEVEQIASGERIINCVAEGVVNAPNRVSPRNSPDCFQLPAEGASQLRASKSAQNASKNGSFKLVSRIRQGTNADSNTDDTDESDNITVPIRQSKRKRSLFSSIAAYIERDTPKNEVVPTRRTNEHSSMECTSEDDDDDYDDVPEDEMVPNYLEMQKKPPCRNALWRRTMEN